MLDTLDHRPASRKAQASQAGTSPDGSILHVLLIDDDQDHLATLADVVQASGLETSTASTLVDARASLAKRTPDLVLLDVNLPDGSGLELVEELAVHPTTVVVVVTGHGTVPSAVEAMRQGASDYLTKPVDIDRIQALLASVMQTRALKAEIGSLRTELRKLGRFGPLIGSSPAMQKTFDLISKAAPTHATVLIIGETGTGKELVAHALHEMSRRRKEPFVTINCGSISPNLIESELFGHEKGSFTGADRQHRGVFERAHLGTIFLDEVTEMSAELQVKLLRVLETRQLQRVGGQQPLDVDVRVVAATNRRPSEAVTEGKLREDLFYRLNVFPIELPPLRDRADDVQLLAEHFVEAFNQEHGTGKALSRAAVQRLRAHTWPGNVRELRNLMERACIVSGDTVSIDAIPLGLDTASGTSLQIPIGTSLPEAEKRLILSTLDHCREDKKMAAGILRISLKTLYNRINEYAGRS